MLWGVTPFSQANDLDEKRPEKLEELQALWFEEAKKDNVLPLDDRRYERVADPTRPVAAQPRSEYVYYSGTSILHPLAAPQILGVEYKITANAEITTAREEGVLACSGGEFGGRVADCSTHTIISSCRNIRLPQLHCHAAFTHRWVR
jgi:arylsulfatase